LDFFFLLEQQQQDETDNNTKIQNMKGGPPKAEVGNTLEVFFGKIPEAEIKLAVLLIVPVSKLNICIS